MSTMTKFNVNQSVVHKGKTTTIEGITLTGKGKMYALANGKTVSGTDLKLANSGIVEGHVPKTFPVPKDKERERLKKPIKKDAK